MVVDIQNRKIDMKDISRCYPAAIIKYADGTVTQISLEWFDEMADENTQLLQYAIYFHYKKEKSEPLVFTYSSREELEKEMARLARTHLENPDRR